MSEYTASQLPQSRWPWHGWLGLGLVAVFWPLNWGLTDLRTHWAFFPLWLGYCLAVDALVCRRKGDSMLTRSPLYFVLLFFVSSPAWWLFELLNLRTQNWLYLGAERFSRLEYVLHVFEMPLLGYGGYVVFAWELFALYSLVVRLVGRHGTVPFLSICPPRRADATYGPARPLESWP